MAAVITGISNSAELSISMPSEFVHDAQSRLFAVAVTGSWVARLVLHPSLLLSWFALYPGPSVIERLVRYSVCVLILELVDMLEHAVVEVPQKATHLVEQIP
ncbi:hypothetical protein PHYPSEUDO_008854 [Phytophthora pseudosyringae]|uniref:Uncharacterized protein n=1 Tax=Phytophthora pseudosyringae TaxID=221518 RepID=A0A8T1VGI9_9STRA|nr:hypothetical protein PHYPSEUDO_008854 [Phytophthora pseudosyringae]